MSTDSSSPVDTCRFEGDVLVVKCLDGAGHGYDGYDWSPDRHDIGDKWNSMPQCDGGGYYGWPLGFGIGEGKQPNSCRPWIVVRVPPESPRVMIDGKMKFKFCDVVHRGTMASCLHYTHADRMGWIAGNAKVITSGYGSSAATSGPRSSAATSGERSSAATSGHQSSAATSGHQSSAATSGYRSSAATSGEGSSAATSGERSSAATSGEGSSAATSGHQSSAATSGYRSSAATSGHRSSAATSGYRSSAATSGEGSSAATSGYRSSAATSGHRSSAATSGEGSSAKSVGDHSVACISDATRDSVIEVSSTGIAAVIGEVVQWMVHTGAILVQRWDGGHAILVGGGDDEGKCLKVIKGVIER